MTHFCTPEISDSGDNESQSALVVDSITDHESDAEDGDFQFSDVSNSETCAWLIKLAISTGDDFSDETWLPLNKARHSAQQNKSTMKPKEYKKG